MQIAWKKVKRVEFVIFYPFSTSNHGFRTSNKTDSYEKMPLLICAEFRLRHVVTYAAPETFLAFHCCVIERILSAVIAVRNKVQSVNQNDNIRV